MFSFAASVAKSISSSSSLLTSLRLYRYSLICCSKCFLVLASSLVSSRSFASSCCLCLLVLFLLVLLVLPWVTVDPEVVSSNFLSLKVLPDLVLDLDCLAEELILSVVCTLSVHFDYPNRCGCGGSELVSAVLQVFGDSFFGISMVELAAR